MAKKYKNPSYVMRTDDGKWYVGCITCNEPLTKAGMMHHSGNPYKRAYSKGLISKDEYFSKVHIVYIIEHDCPEEAMDSEEWMIWFFKLLYGEDCLNIQPGNKHKLVCGEMRRRMSEGMSRSWQDEEKSARRRAKMGEAKKGMLWWNDGSHNMRSKEPPGEGWVRGQLRKKADRS